MQVPTTIKITRCASQSVELADIVTITRETAKAQIDEAWWKGLRDTLQDPDDEPDSHWEWCALVSKYQNKPSFRAVGVASADNLLQAAMLFQVDAFSAITSGQRAVFVDRLASAPWNRENLVTVPLFRGAGKGLLLYAIAVSHSLGYAGRVNLLPVANEQFYIQRGFVPTSRIIDGETLFELPADAARVILKARGFLDG